MSEGKAKNPSIKPRLQSTVFCLPEDPLNGWNCMLIEMMHSEKRNHKDAAGMIDNSTVNTQKRGSASQIVSDSSNLCI